MTPLPLVADGRYRAAAAQLPGRFSATRDFSGAVVVVEGRGWASAARVAFDSDALAVICAAPEIDAAEDIDALERAAAGRPIVIEGDRAGIVAPDHPPDLAAVVVECAAAGGHEQAVLRDALAWVRSLTPGGFALRTTARGSSGDSACALLETVDGATPISIVVARSRRSPYVRVSGIGPTRVEIVDDAARTRPEVTLVDSAGRRILPPVWERVERRALRRVAEAVGDPREARGDLAVFRRHEQIARAILNR